MKKIQFFLIAIFTIYVIGCNVNNEIDTGTNKIEIHKISFTEEYSFNIDDMQIDQTWNFSDNKDIIILQTVYGDLFTKGAVVSKPTFEGYNTYFMQIQYKDDSGVEEWLFWLDESLQQKGVAENAMNPKEYREVSLDKVRKIMNLIN